MTETGVLLSAVMLGTLTVGILTGIVSSVHVWRGASLKKTIFWLVCVTVGFALGWAVTSAFVDPILDSVSESLRANGIVATVLWLTAATPGAFILFSSVLVKKFIKMRDGA